MHFKNIVLKISYAAGDAIEQFLKKNTFLGGFGRSFLIMKYVLAL